MKIQGQLLRAAGMVILKHNYIQTDFHLFLISLNMIVVQIYHTCSTQQLTLNSFTSA